MTVQEGRHLGRKVPVRHFEELIVRWIAECRHKIDKFLISYRDFESRKIEPEKESGGLVASAWQWEAVQTAVENELPRVMSLDS